MPTPRGTTRARPPFGFPYKLRKESKAIVPEWRTSLVAGSGQCLERPRGRWEGHPRGRRSAAARARSTLVLAWLEPVFAETGQRSASAGPPLVLHCTCLFPSRLVFGESRISKPRSTCFSRHNANTGVCLRLLEAEGGWWVRTLQQSEELPEGLSLLRLPGS